MTTSKISVSLIAIIGLVAGGYFLVPYYAESKARTHIAEIEPQIKKVFSYLTGISEIDGYVFSYEITSAKFSGTIHLESVALKDPADNTEKQASFSVAELIVSRDGDLVTINSAKDIKFRDAEGNQIELGSLRIKQLPISKLSASKNVGEFLNNLSFEDSEWENVVVKGGADNLQQSITELYIGKYSNGMFSNLEIKNLLFQENTNEPRLEIRSVRIDRVGDIRPVVLGNDDDTKKAATNAFAIGSLKIEDLVFEEIDSGAINIGTLEVKIDRTNTLITKVSIGTSGNEISRAALLDLQVLPSDILELHDKETFFLEGNLLGEYFPNTSSAETKLSVGLEELGLVAIETVFGGISQQIYEGLAKGQSIEKPEENITLKSIGLSFENNGLLEIALKTAEKDGLTRDQIVFIADQAIEQDVNFNSEKKAEAQNALQTFVESGKRISFRLNAKKPAGVTFQEVVGSFFTGSLDTLLEPAFSAE